VYNSNVAGNLHTVMAGFLSETLQEYVDYRSPIKKRKKD